MLFADLTPLFAQAAGGAFRPANNQAQPPDAELVAGIITAYFGCIGFLLVVGYVIRLLHARSMVNCLKEIAPRNRTVEPGFVWLSAIPLVGGILHIISMFKLPESVKNEFYDRGWREDGDFGKTLAIIYLVCAFVAGPAALVVFIMYWSKMSGYTKQFQERPARREYDEDDGRPRRSRRRNDEEDDDGEDDDRPRRRRGED